MTRIREEEEWMRCTMLRAVLTG